MRDGDVAAACGEVAMGAAHFFGEAERATRKGRAKALPFMRHGW
jgi:hypothetical protein